MNNLKSLLCGGVIGMYLGYCGLTVTEYPIKFFIIIFMIVIYGELRRFE